MIFERTGLEDAYLIRPEKRGDDRGFFARAWCERELSEEGLVTRIAQANMSRSADLGTLRGMHLQVPPHAETKIIRCTAGAVYDVIEHNALYVPEGFAHGFLTLEPDTEVYYLVSEFYSPDSERGIRYDDPAFGIDWPVEVRVVSEKDASWPDYRPIPELADL